MDSTQFNDVKEYKNFKVGDHVVFSETWFDKPEKGIILDITGPETDIVHKEPHHTLHVFNECYEGIYEIELYDDSKLNETEVKVVSSEENQPVDVYEYIYNLTHKLLDEELRYLQMIFKNPLTVKVMNQLNKRASQIVETTRVFKNLHYNVPTYNDFHNRMMIESIYHIHETYYNLLDKVCEDGFCGLVQKEIRDQNVQKVLHWLYFNIRFIRRTMIPVKD